MMLQAYVVANKGKKNEQRELIFFGEEKRLAINRIRDAIASGFDYGYIKEGFETIAYLTEKSFLVTADSGRTVRELTDYSTDPDYSAQAPTERARRLLRGE